MSSGADGILPEDLRAVLVHAARRLRETRLPGTLAAELERLAEQVNQPCVVAVVGRAKAGKSTFINALLGEDLATVGVTETTATINFFRYGVAPPEAPVRCFWRNGGFSKESRAWLAQLQGNDEATLRLADGIDHLEYHLPSPLLERVTLVDTPGMASAVDEHQARLADFMGLRGQLRQRHEQETHRLAHEADAIIFLIGPVARTTDRDFLEEFQQVTRGQSRAVNAVGVLAQIDLSPEVVAGRAERAAKIAEQLQGSLNVVVPVSAGLRRALDELLANQRDGLRRLRAALGPIPPATLETLLTNDLLYRQWEPPDCPVSAAEREALLGAMPWTVFTTIAHLAADNTLSEDEVVARLEEIAGFADLREVLERRFVKRGPLLRCYRIVSDARRVLESIRYEQVPTLRRQERDNATKLARFQAFLGQASSDAAVAKELEGFVREHLAPGADVKEVLAELDRDFAQLFYELETYNADDEALQLLEDHAGEFSPEELEELRPLLGLYGLELEKRLPSGLATDDGAIDERQQFWYRVSEDDRSAVRREVAERAVARYGMAIDAMMARAAAGDGGRAG